MDIHSWGLTDWKASESCGFVCWSQEYYFYHGGSCVDYYFTLVTWFVYCMVLYSQEL